MSKIGEFTLLIIFGLILAGCGSSSSESIAFNAEEVADEILTSKIDDLSIPSNATPAEKLLYLLELNKSMDAMLITTQAELRQVLSGDRTKDEIAELELAQHIAREEFQLMMPELISKIAKIYEAKFSEAELIAAINFYQSELGRKFIKSQTEMMAETAHLIPEFQRDLEARVAARLEKEE